MRRRLSILLFLQLHIPCYFFMVLFQQGVGNVFQLFQQRVLSLFYPLLLVLYRHRHIVALRLAQLVAFVVDVLYSVDEVGRVEEADGHIAEGSLLCR